MILVCYRSPDHNNPNPDVDNTLHYNLQQRYGYGNDIEGVHTIADSGKWLFVDLTTSKVKLTSDILTRIHRDNIGGITEILVGPEILSDDIAYLRSILLHTPIYCEIRLVYKLFNTP